MLYEQQYQAGMKNHNITYAWAYAASEPSHLIPNLTAASKYTAQIRVTLTEQTAPLRTKSTIGLESPPPERKAVNELKPNLSPGPAVRSSLPLTPQPAR